MSVFVSSPGFGYLIEYGFDEKQDVIDYYHFLMANQVLYVLSGADEETSQTITTLVNFALVPTVNVTDVIVSGLARAGGAEFRQVSAMLPQRGSAEWPNIGT